jgi:riboflavin biosynthesis pyrimidine reductase
MLRGCPSTGRLARAVRSRSWLERGANLAARHRPRCVLSMIGDGFHLNHRRLRERRFRYAEREQAVCILGGDHRRIDIERKLEVAYERSIMSLDEMEARADRSLVPLPPTPPGALVERLSGQPADIIATLAARGIDHIYVDGGITIQRFLQAGLIQRLIITRVPVLIGSGIPLFGPLMRDVVVTHVATRQYTSGLVQSEYSVTS